MHLEGRIIPAADIMRNVECGDTQYHGQRIFSFRRFLLLKSGKKLILMSVDCHIRIQISTT